jgi:deoxyadenosine/deoxycytidine kinase
MKLHAAEAKLIFEAAQHQVIILQARLDKVRDRRAVSGNDRELRHEEEGFQYAVNLHRSLAAFMHRNELPVDEDLVFRAVHDLGEFANYTSSMETSRAIEALIKKLLIESDKVRRLERGQQPA